jgi:hypothetical protein
VRGKKFILDRIMQIDEIVEAAPEYKRLGERPNELLESLSPSNCPPKIIIY